MRLAIIGAGRMGHLRARCARSHPECEIVHVIDTDVDRARELAGEIGCQAGAEWQSVFSSWDLDAVVVATPHKYLAPITRAALLAGKHVFCEKPMGRTASDAKQVLQALSEAGALPGVGPQTTHGSYGTCFERITPVVVVGFTLRHHPAIDRAWQMLQAGAIGEPYYIRAHYGHGGRPGYDQEWRAQPELSGGGELLDQGIHLIDLSRWFLGEFREVTGYVETYFWNAGGRSKRPQKTGWRSDPEALLHAGEPRSSGSSVEDNAFLLLRSANGRVASLHASWTQWKNSFAFAVYGRDGFISVDGLGGSYGSERLVVGRRSSVGVPPEISGTVFRTAGDKRPELITELATETSQEVAPGEVWVSEWNAFVSLTQNLKSAPRDPRSANATDAWQALRIVEAGYQASQLGATVVLEGLPDSGPAQPEPGGS